MKILVTGDIHIGKRSSAIDGNYAFLSAAYTWERIVDYATGNGVDLVILTGDIIDRENRFFEAVSPLRKGLERLAEHCAGVCLVAGNHDYDVLPEIVRAVDSPNVFLLGEKGMWEERLIEKDGQMVQLIGRSFTSPYHTFDPVKTFPAEKIRKDMPTIGIVHGDAFSQNSKYAPLNTYLLKEIRGVDAWLLGHIHKPQTLHPHSPLILYPGSPHALSPKETGIHGVYLPELHGGRIQAELLPLSPVRYEQLTVDVSGVTDKDSFRQTLSADLKEYAVGLRGTERLKYLVYDVVLTGKSDRLKDLQQWNPEELLMYSGSNSFEEKVRKIRLDIDQEIDTASFLNDPSYMGVLVQAILALEKGETNSFIEQLKKQWKDNCEAMTQSNAYTPLVQGRHYEPEKIMTDSLLKECRRLFTELYNQRKNED
jgi:DNA repair exonuclease SbcCD nuclease subunit